MKIGAIDYCLPDMPWEELCDTFRNIGLEAIEVCAGALDGKMHCDPGILIRDDNLLEDFLKPLKKNNLEISTLSVHANPLHPQKAYADKHISDIKDVIALASKIGVEIITTFAGLPGAGEDAVYPNWIIYPWPEYFDQSVVHWQWEKKVIPFWTEMVKEAKKAKVKFAFELHPADIVYNTESFLRLKENVDADEIGCTIDPGHFPFQGIDTIAIIKKLGRYIYNFHVKDGVVKKDIADLNGVLD
jgi:sugar phosphate isomerase/epimerase